MLIFYRKGRNVQGRILYALSFASRRKINVPSLPNQKNRIGKKQFPFLPESPEERIVNQVNDLTTAFGFGSKCQRVVHFLVDFISRIPKHRCRFSADGAHVPAVLQEKVGMDALFSRVPQSYQKAIFARSVASGFIYRFGVDAGFEDYRRYVEELAAG